MPTLYRHPPLGEREKGQTSAGTCDDATYDITIVMCFCWLMKWRHSIQKIHGHPMQSNIKATKHKGQRECIVSSHVMSRGASLFISVSRVITLLDARNQMKYHVVS